MFTCALCLIYIYTLVIVHRLLNQYEEADGDGDGEIEEEKNKLMSNSEDGEQND